MPARNDETSGSASYVAGLVKGLTEEFRDYRGERRRADEARDEKMADHIAQNGDRLRVIEDELGFRDEKKLKQRVQETELLLRDLQTTVRVLRTLVSILVGILGSAGIVSAIVYQVRH